jgi:hypothetical protein
MDAHESLYLAAVAGMADTYGQPHYTIGAGVTFRLEGWSPTSYADGTVRNHTADGMLVVEHDDLGVLQIDPRPWPTGNMLPF